MWKKNNLILFFFTAAFLSGCSEKPEKKDYVARVNDSYLTQDELDEVSDSSFKNNFYKSEIIRNWIDEELLYQEALSEGILDEEEYKRIIYTSRKELAGALLLKQVSDKYEFTYSQTDLENFYQTYSDEFRLRDNALLLNVAEFNSEDEAIKFRISVMHDGWQKIIETEKGDLLKEEENLMVSEEDIYPLFTRNLLQELYPQEISIVINTDSTSYKIFQVIEKYPEGTIPPFNLIKDKVEKRYIAHEKRKFVNGYIKKLYSENDIEVKNQDNR